VPREDTLYAGSALRCGDVVLVPVVRVAARAFRGFVWDAEAEVLGFVTHGAATPGRFLALAPQPRNAPSWSAWLEARPELLVEIRQRLAGAARGRGPSGHRGGTTV
jgi:hypothetical protein